MHRRFAGFLCGQHRAAELLKSISLGVLAVLLLASVVWQTRGSHALKLSRRSFAYGTKEEEFSTEIAGFTGLSSWLTYVSEPQAALKLGCPLNHTIACFYRFYVSGEEIQAPTLTDLVTEGNCNEVFKPLPSDWGRSWCVREGKEPAWLREMVPESQRSTRKGPVLLTGKLDSPNPTHQANLHFLGIWKWTRRLGLKPGELSMIVDHDNPAWAPGKFGSGLARALGTLDWLPQLDPGMVHFEQIQFSIPNAELFPFDLKHYVIDSEIDLAYIELAENVKARIGPPLPSGGTPSDVRWRAEVLSGLRNESQAPASDLTAARRPRVIVSKRRESETRIWGNAHEFANFLRDEYEMDAEVVTFGDLSFEDQVKTVGSADVLVGVTGSDLVNLMFLPQDGAIVEIFPALEHQNVFVPELGNMAAMLGKNHFTYVSNGDIEVDEGQTRLLYRTKRINVAVPDLAALVSHAAHQAISGSTLEYHSCYNWEGMVKCQPNRPHRLRL